MKTVVLLLAGLAVMAGGCVRAQNLEKSGYVATRDVVPDLSLSGSLYRVRPQAYCDGLVATFWIDARDGSTYRATGTPLLYQRIAEIGAIAKLRQMDSGENFGNSLGNTAENTVTSVGKTISDPGSFFKSIPEGASKFFGSIGENMKGGKSEYEGRAYSSALGQSKAKRLLAFQLGVNPYSTNETLQKELNRVGWSQAGGAVLVNVAVSAIPAGAGTGLNMNRNLQSAVASQDPAQLGIMNRKRFESIGIDADEANELLKHKWYSPLHRTAITDALVSLGPGHGQEVFLDVLTRASNEVDANYFQQTAELIEQYNRSVARVGKIQRTGRTVSFYDAKGDWVIPVPFDYCLWTQDVRDRARRALAGREPGRTLILYTTGNFSSLAAAQCARDNISVMRTTLGGD